MASDAGKEKYVGHLEPHDRSCWNWYHCLCKCLGFQFQKSFLGGNASKMKH